MNHQSADLLLERYFAGETTLEEEHSLRAYFRAGDVHPDHVPYQDLFAYWTLAGQVQPPAPRLVVPAQASPRRRQPVLRWMAAAAAAAVLLLAGNSWFDANPALSDFPIAEQQSATTVDWSRYEVTDEKEAFLVLRAALKTASTNLNEGPRITLKELKELDAILD
jgi:hypothetical protein